MDKVIKAWNKTNRWHRGLLIFLIIELKVLPAGQRGFTCNDPALSHTFHGDTITWKHLFATVLLLPLAVMLVIERTYHRDNASRPKKQALRWYKEYLFGFLLNLIVVQGVKMIVGAPRPHFFDTCAPHEALTCEGSEYVPRYSCSKPPQFTSESSKSFPSGHTSLAVHGAIFIAYYLYRRANESVIVYLSQAVLVLSAAYCGVSRMVDHRHHWWDVLGGGTVALPILFYTIFQLCKDFEPPKQRDVESDRSNDLGVGDSLLIDSKDTLQAK